MVWFNWFAEAAVSQNRKQTYIVFGCNHKCLLEARTIQVKQNKGKYTRWTSVFDKQDNLVIYMECVQYGALPYSSSFRWEGQITVQGHICESFIY